MWQSSNPILANNDDAFSQYYGNKSFLAGAEAKANVTTLQGVVNKTAILVGIAVACGAIGYGAFANYPQVLWISGIASLVICLGIGLVLRGKPSLAPIYAPIYAVTEGVFLGAFTAIADSILAARGLAVAGGVGVQAFIVTAAVMISMLLLYKARIIKPTETLKSVICVATGGVMLACVPGFVRAELLLAAAASDQLLQRREQLRADRILGPGHQPVHSRPRSAMAGDRLQGSRGPHRR